MSPSPAHRVRLRTLWVIFVSAILPAVTLPYGTRQYAAFHNYSTARFTLPDKGSITPQGNIITVNSLSEVANGSDGLCTLREAITAANNNAQSGIAAGECTAGSSSGSDTIDLTGLAGTIALTSALPAISADAIISGPGSSVLTVQRNGNFDGLSVSSGAVTISALTIQGVGTVGNGGISNSGVLNVTDCKVTGFGRGILNGQNTVTISNCLITGNTNGGGISNSSGTVNLINSVLSGNLSHGEFGPGIDNNSGTLNVNNSTITGSSGHYAISNGVGAKATFVNSTVSNNGTGGLVNNGTLSMTGGLVTGNTGPGLIVGGTALINGVTVSSNVNNSGTPFGGAGIFINGLAVTVMNCLVINNSSAGPGAGINNGGGKATLINNTISGNASNSGGGGVSSFDGGLASFVAINLTITGNRSNQGGGVFRNQAGVMKFKNCLIAGNFALNGTTPNDISGPIDASSSFNLVGTGGSGGLTNGVNNNQVGVASPGLGPLANNGGPTQTFSLLSTSPALDAGDNCITDVAHCGDPGIPQVTTDQRGVNRVVDGPDADATAAVDIGAYEAQGPLANLPDTSTNEDTPLLVGFDPGDTSTFVSVTATSSNPAIVPNDSTHLSAALAGTTGIISINPVADLSGTSNITVTVNRTGGSENKTFMLTVNAVNEAPSFTKGANQTVNEDAGPQTVSGWATNISPGPGDESSQTLTFQVTNTNTALFSAGPSISPTGTLAYTPAPDANGSATLTISLKDDGGTSNGGVDTSASQTFTITVNAVNDAPSFTKGPDVTVNNNTGAQSISNWATNISVGPPNESQSRSFQVVNNTNPAIFSAGPSISSVGTLSFTPASNAGGTTTITINLKDTGGTANGGVDTSPSQSFTIAVVPVGGSISFAAASTNTTESSGAVTVTVNRSGDLSRAVTVDYSTNAHNGLPCSNTSGVASPKCDFTAALGTLNFAASETSKTFTVLISQDSFVEGPETLTVTLANPTNSAALAAPSSTLIMIADDPAEPPANLIDDVRNFVRQHYHDFLNREPDPGGWDFWANQITSCGSDAQCGEVHRIDVSASFFLSIEFQQTGYLVERFYKVAYGNAIGNSTFNGAHTLSVPIVKANEFLSDTQRIGQGVVVLQPGWEQALENNKQAYALEFVQRTRFTSAFPVTMFPVTFVDRMNQNAGNVLSASERQAAIDLFGAASNTSNLTARAQAIRLVAEDTDLYNAEFNRAFVLAQYIGYLRRNPDDAPDSDHTGFDFWLTKLNQFNGSYTNAEMVKAFLSSIEYRQRFGP